MRSLNVFGMLVVFFALLNQNVDAQTLANGGLLSIQYDCDQVSKVNGETMGSKFTSLETLCNLIDQTGMGCKNVANVCKKKTRELFVGTQIELATPQNLKDWNGLGGLGAFYNPATVCLMRDIKNLPDQKIVNIASIPLIKGTGEQEIGFTGFDQKSGTFFGYHKLRACGKVVGCLDIFTQEFELKPVTSHVQSLGFRAGDYAIKDAYAIELKTDVLAQGFTAKLPSIEVVTPIGPVSVTPEFRLGRYSDLVSSPFGGNKQSSYVSSYFKGDTNRTYDVYGRNIGAYATTMSPLDSNPGSVDIKFSQKGWISNLALGGRDSGNSNAIWKPNPNTEFPIRPDLTLKTSRSEEEKTPNAYLGASALVSYGISDKLPSSLIARLSCSGFVELCLNAASVYAKPSIDFSFSSQLNFFQNEQSYWNQKHTQGEFPKPVLTLDTFDQSRELKIQSLSSVNGALSIESGLNLNISLRVHGPFGFSKTLIDLTPKIEVPLYSKSEYSKQREVRAQSLGSSVVSQKKFFQDYTSWDQANQAAYSDDGGLKAIQQCMKEPGIEKKSPPEMKYERGDPSFLGEILEQPCNICVAWDEVNYKDDNGNDKTEAAGLYTILPTTQAGVPLENRWTCKSARQSGCYDMCRYLPDGTREISRTAVQLLKTGTAEGMPKSCKADFSTHGITN
ncbi:MAG: hypothetical protein JST80_02840 [Bdellovibrionales bacterium]|nr:hypothetical protein [Bdellovibrionales bacterium]